jgi:hypothetical protein
MKAWMITEIDWPEMKLVVAAPTRGKAIALVDRQKMDTGYPSSFVNFRGARAPSFDDHPDADEVKVLGWADGCTRYGCLEVPNE